MGKITKNEILEVSYQEFLNNGYDKTTLRQLSSKLNITHGNILYYFKSKDLIALELLRKYFDLWFISCDIFFSQETKRQFDKNSLYQTIIHFNYMSSNRAFANFYVEFLKNNSDLFIDTFKSYFTNYVDTFADTNYEQAHIKEEMDVMLIVEANVKLVKYILNDSATIKEASIYIYNLLNLLWGLEKSYDEIESEIDTALAQMFKLEKVSQFIEQEMLKQ